MLSFFVRGYNFWPVFVFCKKISTSQDELKKKFRLWGGQEKPTFGEGRRGGIPALVGNPKDRGFIWANFGWSVDPLNGGDCKGINPPGLLGCPAGFVIVTS